MIITYNHAKYIGEAIDSVLAQKTDFDFAIHVIDDCSTDGAQDIIRDYAARYPGVVKPFINKKNIGSKVTQRNFYRGFCTLDGDYISFLEGDDYWTSPDRLQTHVDFLEANPDFVACAGNTLKVYEDGSNRAPHVFLPAPPKEVHDISDLISNSFFHASSLTFRNVFRGRVPRYLRSPLSCDIFLNIAHGQYGKVRYFQNIWSVYRAHGGGLFSTMSETKGWMWNIDGLRACNRWLRYRYAPQFAWAIYRFCDLPLREGREEDGFTPQKRRRYAAIRRRYRALDKGFRWLDILLARWIPGRRAKSAPATLDLGAGRQKTPHMISVDVRRDVDPDMVVDLERTPWPWPDNYAEEVRFLFSLEHMGRDFETFQAMMRELYRVCQPDARVLISAKHPRNDSFINDPTCVRVINAAVLSLFDRRTPADADPKPVAERNKVDFQLLQEHTVLAEPYLSQLKSGRLSVTEAHRLVTSNLNVCDRFQITLQVRKPARPPEPPVGGPSGPGVKPPPA
jgi:hypothetical protein